MFPGNGNWYSSFQAAWITDLNMQNNAGNDSIKKLLVNAKRCVAFLSPQTQKVILVLSFVITVKLETVTSGSTRIDNALDDSTALPYKGPLLTWRDDCDGMLCEVANGIYLLNTTFCAENVQTSINTSRSYTVRILIEPENDAVLCKWDIAGHINHYTNVTVEQIRVTHRGKFRFMFREIIDGKYVFHQEAVSSAKLQRTHFSFMSLYLIRVVFQILESLSINTVTFDVVTREGSYMRNLPVVMLSDTVGYVTSPGFGRNRNYPNNYDGEFRLNVGGDESVLVNIVSFHIVSHSDAMCAKDVLLLRVLAVGKQYRLCTWKKNKLTFVFHSSLNLIFHTDSANNQRGFKVMFTILPRAEEPERLSNTLFNCSVPSFHKFKPVLSCNLLMECAGGEDEQDCGRHRSNDCGSKKAIDAGTRCYILVFQEDLTWQDAHKICIRRGQKLATLGSPHEFQRFQELVPPRINLKGYFIGARLMDRLQSASITVLYKNIWQWVDGRTVFSVQIYDYYKKRGSCALYDPWLAKVNSVVCHEKRRVAAFACEFYKPGEGLNTSSPAPLHATISMNSTSVLWNVTVNQCSLGHVTKNFLSCDFKTDCDALYSMTSCSSGGVTVSMFVCQQTQATVHYSLVCDHMQHCYDNSDEDFCKFPECSHFSLKCRNGQCIQPYQQCDGNLDCYDGSDEDCRPKRYSIATTSPPGAIHLGSRGNFWTERMNESDKCPSTHFLCPQGFCLPVYLRCNGIYDCSGREDEIGCDSYKCRGYYRCRGSKMCLHARDVCDGIPQCPEQDDEMLCNLICPDSCHCQGLAFVCNLNFSATSYRALRYLDASTSNMTLTSFRDNIHLVVLRSSRCQIRHLPLNLTFPNLRELDLSWNYLYQLHINNINSLDNLRVLVLTGNPLVRFVKSESGSIKLRLEHVDISYTSLEMFSGSLFGRNSNIKILNMSRSKLKSIEDGFHAMPGLETLDLRGCRLMKFPMNLLRHLRLLKTVYSENYKLCCEAMLPINFQLKNCHATDDLMASCEDLLKSNSYRIFLWLFASLSLLGNLFSISARLYHHQEGRASGSFGLLVTNLSVADFFMGVYLAIIGTADLVYRGNYLWRDDGWKDSAACNIAGCLCLLSSEVSAFIIYLITLDRFLVIRFPFSTMHFGRRSAMTACGLVWATGVSLAVIPLLPMTSHWEFYKQTGICIPLPFTNSEIFHGYNYSFSVSILLNLVLFLLIAVGQAVIYRAVRANSMPSSSSSTNARMRDATIARRLVTVVVSDFLCWFPVGLLGLLASTGTPIPGDFNVAVAVFVLPVNSALNPFLYTFNLFMEKRRKAQYEMLLRRLELERRSQVEMLKDKPRTIATLVDKVAAIQQIKSWVVEQLLTPEDLLSCSSLFDNDSVRQNNNVH